MNQRQEHFNTVWNRIVAQGQPSVDRGSCVYRGPDNTVCAFGALVTDEEAATFTPSSGVGILLSQGKLPERFVEDWKFYAKLQAAHDMSEEASDFVAAFTDRMEDVADAYNLTTPER